MPSCAASDIGKDSTAYRSAKTAIDPVYFGNWTTDSEVSLTCIVQTLELHLIFERVLSHYKKSYVSCKIIVC